MGSSSFAPVIGGRRGSETQATHVRVGSLSSMARVARAVLRRLRVLAALSVISMGSLCLTPQVARADVPAACQANTDAIPGDVNRWLSPPPLTGYSFDCVTSVLLGGTGQPTLVLNLMDHFKIIALSVLGTFLMLEVVFAGMFDGRRAPASTGRAIGLTIGMALLIQNYDLVIECFRQSAIAGSVLIHEAVQESANTPIDGALALSRADAGQMADQIVAQYGVLQAKADRAATDSSFALTADETARLQQLSQYTDLNNCMNMAAQAPPRQSAFVQSTCHEIYNRRHRIIGTIDRITSTAVDVLKAPFDLAKEVVNYSIIKTVSWVVEWLIGALTASAGAFLATLFAAACAIGPVCLALVPFRFGRGAGAWWFKCMLSLTLMPFALALATGLYYGGVDMIAAYNDANPAATVIEYFVLLATTMTITTVGWRRLNTLSSGFVAAGAEIGAVAVNAAGAIATAGFTGFAGATAGGSGMMASFGSATRAMGGEFARQTGGLAGGVAASMLPRPPARVYGETATSDRTLARVAAAGADHIATGVGAMAARFTQSGRRAAAALGPGGGGTLEEPGRFAARSAAERSAGANHAGAALMESLQAGRDFTVDAHGGIQLTPAGGQVVSSLRQAGSARYRTMDDLTNDDFVNQPAIASRLAGRHSSPLEGIPLGAHGSTERSIAEMLPASVVAPQNANERSNQAMHAQRLSTMIQTIRQRSGGSWISVEAQIASIAQVAARQATAPSGQTYGIDVSTAGPSIPPAGRRYTYQAGSHLDMELRQNPTLPQEAGYQRAMTRVRQQFPPTGDENPATYTSRLHRYVFMNATEAQYAEGGVA